MRKGLWIAVAIALLLIGISGCKQQKTATTPPATTTSTTPATSTSPPPQSLAASLPPMPGPGDWASEITNPWLPFIPGTTFVYRGVKDGQPTVDTYVVTNRKKDVNGVQATVVQNILRTGAHVIEGTEDWYAQDNAGNVWYLGEATTTFDKNGKPLSTTGSWQAGVNGAQGGLFMPADPKVGDSYYQEYYQGQAEDRYTVISLEGTITVPYGSFKGVLVTEEKTALEPTVVSQKYYARGTGQLYENDVQGGTEYAKLVKITKR